MKRKEYKIVVYDYYLSRYGKRIPNHYLNEVIGLQVRLSDEEREDYNKAKKHVNKSFHRRFGFSMASFCFSYLDEEDDADDIKELFS
jgi:hypothetical protein